MDEGRGAYESVDADTQTAIAERVERLLGSVPDGVAVVAAAKGASVEQVTAAVHAGIRVLGHNYIPDARRMRARLDADVEWHYIGRLRLHDIRASSLRLFDVLQTVDSLRMAERIDALLAPSGVRMPVLVEVNSGREPQKAGVLPEQAEDLISGMSRLSMVRVMGLMTMGPPGASPEEYRTCFGETRRLFERIARLNIPGVEMRHLSMGMSDSFHFAIQEGATMIRVGTLLFGNRQQAPGGNDG